MCKEYFYVSVREYDPSKEYTVVRPASLNKPKNNAIMFILENYMDRADVFNTVERCLIFWPKGVKIPDTLKKKHAIVECTNPHLEYCRFFCNHNITYLPVKEAVDCVNGAFISPKAKIGENVVIMPGAYIGGECIIGDGSYIGCGAKLVGEVLVGKNVVIRENAVVGADGLTTDRDTDGSAVTMPQFGNVVLEDNVQIGANAVIARGAIDETRICRGAKIDNACFISHNVTVGENAFIVGESIMFGSSSIGRNSMISGNATVRNGVHIGNYALVGMGSVVTKPVPDYSVVKGNPAK